jgi:hypothetical protein
LFAYDCAMLTDEEADKIRRDVEDGVRGPVLLKYVRVLLADRDERRRGDDAAPSPRKPPR